MILEGNSQLTEDEQLNTLYGNRNMDLSQVYEESLNGCNEDKQRKSRARFLCGTLFGSQVLSANNVVGVN